MTSPAALSLGVQAESEQAERDRLAVPVDFAALFASLPADDPDRHDLDPLDAAFAHLAPGYPTEVTA